MSTSHFLLMIRLTAPAETVGCCRRLCTDLLYQRCVQSHVAHSDLWSLTKWNFITLEALYLELIGEEVNPPANKMEVIPKSGC